MPLFVWALFVAFLRFCFLCGAAGVQGAACCVRPGCAVGSGPPASRPRCEPFARVGCCLWLRWCSGRRMARPPARLGNLTSFGAAPRSPPVPSGPSGALHTDGACSCVLLGQAPPPPTGTAAWPPHPRLGHTSAKKFAQHRQNCPKSALFRLQGELFRGLFQNPLLLGEFFRADECHSHLTAPANHPA